MKDPLIDRIDRHMRIKGLGNIVRGCADYAMRIYLAQKWGQWQQQQMAEEVMKNWLAKDMDKKGHVDSLVYKVIELGELLMCLETEKKCIHANECWITRRGFAPCTEKRMKKWRKEYEKKHKEK